MFHCKTQTIPQSIEDIYLARNSCLRSKYWRSYYIWQLSQNTVELQAEKTNTKAVLPSGFNRENIKQAILVIIFVKNCFILILI